MAFLIECSCILPFVPNPSTTLASKQDIKVWSPSRQWEQAITFTSTSGPSYCYEKLPTQKKITTGVFPFGLEITRGKSFESHISNILSVSFPYLHVSLDYLECFVTCWITSALIVIFFVIFGIQEFYDF